MIKKIASLTILISVLVLSYSHGFAEEPTNYCLKKASWKKWDELIQKYPNDDDIQTLHALRIGLCTKIERGSITFEQANAIFNRAHDMVIEKKKADQKKGEPKL